MLATETRVRKLKALLDRVQSRGTRLGGAATAARPVSRVGTPAPAPVAAAPAAAARPVTADAFNTVPPPVVTVPPPPEATTQPPAAPSVAPAAVSAAAPRTTSLEPVVTHAKLAATGDVARFVGEAPVPATAGDILSDALLD